MPTEAQIRAIQKYEKEKTTTVSVHMPKEKATRLKAACEKLGVSRYSVLMKAVNDTIAKAEEG